MLPRLMLVWGPSAPMRSIDPVGAVGQAVDGGLELLQVRDPEAKPEQLLRLLLGLRRRFPELKLLVNRHADIALEVGSALHLPEETPLPRQWPVDELWGRSVHSAAAARRAYAEGAHYLVLGTVFPTLSKPGHPGAGLDLVWQVCDEAPIPVYAIGGINAERARAVVDAGAHGVAVQRAVLASHDPQEATEALIRATAGLRHVRHQVALQSAL